MALFDITTRRRAHSAAPKGAGMRHPALLVAALVLAGGAGAQDATKDLSSWPVNEPEYVALLCGEAITGPMDYADLLYQAIRQQVEEARTKRGVVLSEKEAFELIRRRTCPTPELQPRKRAR